MRIVRIVVHHLQVPLDPPFPAAWDPVPRTAVTRDIVEVEADDGTVGIGGGGDLAGFDRYAGHFLGTDPCFLEEQSRRVASCSFHGGRFWPVEAACHDLAAKVRDIAVADLLGGATDRVPAYASFGSRRAPSEWSEVAAARAAEGFTAVKLRLDPHDADGAASAVEAVRAGASDLAVMVDLNQAWRMPGDVSTPADRPAVEYVIAALEDQDVTWIEEPLPLDDLDGYRALAGHRVRLAGGEMVASEFEATAVLDAGVLDVFQADATLALGLQRCRALAERCLADGRWYTPHTWTDGLGLVTNLHLTCGVGGGPWIEFPYDPPGWTPEARDTPLVEPVRPGPDGQLTLPAGPGLGVELDGERLAALTVATEEFRL